MRIRRYPARQQAGERVRGPSMIRSLGCRRYMRIVSAEALWPEAVLAVRLRRSRTPSHAPSPCPTPSPPAIIFSAAARHVFPRTPAMSDHQPPPPGIYVPAVLFFKENEDIDEEATKSHVLHLAQVHTLDFLLYSHTLVLTATLNP